MSKLLLKNDSSIDQKVDAIVNAANKYLQAGSGVCGAIYEKAGYQELTEACSKIKTPLEDGDDVITPSFHIKNAKYIIHAIGPNFSIHKDAYEELYKAYYNSLNLLKENNLHSISFPLISSGIYGGTLKHPASVSATACLKAFYQFIEENEDYDIEVILCAYTKKELEEVEAVWN